MPDHHMTDLSRLKIERGPETPSPEQRGSRTGRVLYGIGALVLLGGGFFFYRALTEEPLQVRTAVVTASGPGSPASILTASGYIVAQRKAAIASKATGRIVELNFKEGDVVKKGEIIARIESDDVRASLSEAEADLVVARAEAFEAGRNFERSTSLFNDKLISSSEYDVAKSRFDRMEATVASREAGLRAAQVQVENTNIRAPFSGTVLTKNADIGEVVAPFAAGASSRVAVVTLADMTSLQVEVDVSESKIENVRIGQKTEITLDAYPDRRYAGVVDKIVPTADRAKATVLTKIRFVERDDRVLPEMSAKAHFLPNDQDGNARGGTAQAAQTALAVDRRAIVQSDAGESVFVVEDGRAILRSIRTEPGAGPSARVLSGLSAGQTVVIEPPPGLVEGAEIEIIRE